MGWRFVKQPNDLFGRFSEVVDNFTHLNLTESEMLEMCVELGLSTSEANQKITAAKNDTEYSRWSACIAIIKDIHGLDAVISVSVKGGKYKVTFYVDETKEALDEDLFGLRQSKDIRPTKFITVTNPSLISLQQMAKHWK